MTDTRDNGIVHATAGDTEPYLLPASFAQERLWFFAQLVPDLAVYNLGCPFDLAEFGERPDPDAFEAALADVVARHETLRTGLAMRGGDLVQVVHPSVPVVVTRSDLRGLPPDDRAARADELAMADSATPIPLDDAPLWRARLIRLGEHDWTFVFVVHHAVFDAQSVRNLARELVAGYRARRAGGPAELPDLTIQYGDFAAWQRDRLAGGELADQLDHWRRALADLPGPLRLPAGVGVPEANRHAGADAGFGLPDELGRAVRQHAATAGTTPFVVLLTGFVALLSRLTGQRDLIVGSPVSGRVLPELADLIGMFVNTLVLRVDCTGEPTFGELVLRVRAVVLDALDNQEVPYDRLVEMLAPDRDADGMPLHQVVFNLLPLRNNTQIRNGTTKADLLLDLAPDGDGYDGRLEYRRGLVDRSTAESFGGRLARLLAAGLAAPDTPITRLPVLADDERHAILAASGTPSAEQPPLVTDLFLAAAAAHPDTVAVRDAAGRQLTYAELDRRSAQLAGQLAATVAPGPDSVVGVLLDTDVDLIVAVLAVLRCGAGYLPLDLRHPADRMRYLLADAGAVAVVSDSAVAGLLPDDRPPLITVDTDAAAIAAAPPVPAVWPLPDALAYVVYTSGSTGAPKGVGVSHRNLAGYLVGVRALLRPEPGRVFSMPQTLTFDFSLTMCYGALTTGGTLCLVPRDFAADAQWLAEHLRRDRVDYLKITPSHLRALHGGSDPAALLPRRALLLGGEASRWPWVRELRAVAEPAGCAVLNHYGPTETTVGVLAFPGDRTPSVSRPGFPLGWPLARAAGYVLDDRLELVPDGVPGELVIGGGTVSRGYLGRPGLTAERFVPDPFSAAPGARMYRTGDRARRLPDGSIEFLGRVDDQVKVRGYRVEPGEVAHVLSGAPDVADCVVTVHRPDEDAEPQLVAYVVPVAGATVDTAGLRAFAEQRLPEFMLPSAVVPLAELPLAAHGKVDRARLPVPSTGGDVADAAEASDAPRDDTEDLVAGVFELLLNRRHVRRTDSFFGLGGHSLLAIQMVTRLRAAFGVNIPLRGVFADPSVAGIAAQVRDRLRRRTKSLPPVPSVPRDQPLPVSYGQRRLWFLDRLDSTGPLYHTNVCLRVTGELDPETLRQAFVVVAERHEVLRARFAEQDGELAQTIAETADVPWRVVSAPDADTERELLRDNAETPFDLAARPPLRVLLVRVADGSHLLLITMHHLVNDAWSANLLVREVGELYRSLRTGTPAGLPELTVQYADYAAWQRELVDGELRESQLAYWRDRLAGLPVLALPTDRPRPARQGYAGEHAGFRLPPATVDRLRALGADENASLFMVLLAGFHVLLHRYTGQHDLAVGTPASGRTRPEFEPLLGFFLNTLVLRTDSTGRPTFRELVRRVRTTALDAFANQDVPFEALVEQLAPDRDLGGTPLVRTLFTLEDSERETVHADGLTLTWQPYGTPTAKFDVTIYLWRRPDGLAGAVEYRTDLFDADTMARFAEHYTALLGAAAADPDRPADALPMLTADDTERLAGWNATAVEWPGAQAVPALLAERAAADPNGLAVRCPHDAAELTYGEFAAAVHRLARLLVRRGVRPGDVVGVLAERGPALLTAVHAILAAGAAYLPLDPDQPDRRLAFLVADAGARLVITTSRVTVDAELLVLDEVADELAALPADPVGAPVRPESTAYVLYTSGSTGRPKGAAVAHRALVNRLRWMQETMPIGPGDRVLHKTPVGFDVSVWELCWPLVTGAAVVTAAPGGHRNSRYLVELLATERINTVHFVPPMLAAFLEEPGLDRLTGLRTVVCSGEALRPELADRAMAALPDAALFNLYGPTEAAIDVTAHRCRPGEQAVPIGAPVANTRVHVLDEHGRCTPVGVPGELCLAGVQLADGYPGRPALTADRFVPDPYGPPGSRLYRTGDLGRWRPDGELDYLGRLDHQVKVRGMRVEPAEIEAALVADPGVRAVAVVPVGDPVRLAAYVVPADPSAPPEPATLAARLADTLPAHMVPTAYLVLPELPVTTNGKLDRAALPAPEPATDRPFEAPRGPVEQAVADVWAGVLGTPGVGALDDFFALGGDSIRALKVIARLRAAGYATELVELFARPTVRGLAGALTPVTAAAAPAVEPFALVSASVAEQARTAHGAEDAYPLTDLQAGMLFHSEFAETSPTYHDVFTLRIDGGACVPDALAAALAEVAARHAVLRTSLHVADFAEPTQLVHPGVVPPLTVTDLRGHTEQEATDALAEFERRERAHDFEADVAPLLRVFAYLLPGNGFALTLSFHHAILDGWSVASLSTELLGRYAARLAGSPEPVTMLPLAYRDFVAERLADRTDAADRFWQDTLADAPGTEIPRRAGRRRTAGTGEAATVDTPLPADMVAGLAAVARGEQVPLRTVLLAAHLRVLALLSGQPDVVTGVVTHGRSTHEAGEQVLGLFLNTIAIRARVDRPSWRELVRAVHAAEISAIPHRNHPLARVQRLTGRSPVYDVLFDYRDFHVYGDLPADDRLRITGYSFFEQTDVPFAANLIRSPGTDSLVLRLKYDSAQFEADQVTTVARHYLDVLTALAADPAGDPRPGEPYLADDLERIRAWHATARDYPAGTVPDLVAARAATAPDAVAVRAGDTALTYGELVDRVNRLANYLRTTGVRTGDVVGVCLERGVDLVVTVHAVLAAGAAYLPLEPELPPLRLAGMLDDADVTTVVSTSALADRIPGRRPVLLDEDAQWIAAQRPDRPAEPVPPSGPAYLIYTSGSTGRPKGVSVAHRALANRLHWMQDNYRIGPDDRVLHKTPFGFDVSVWELCWPLLFGAELVVADPGGHRLPGYLTDLIHRRGVTVVHFVPSMLDALLEEPDLAPRLAGVAHVVCSGEALPAELAARLLAIAPHIKLHNLYGPTEAAIDVTAHTYRPGEAVVPIGAPVANTRIEILDGRGDRVPVEVPGELCIGGVQVADGYRGRPALTAERFVPDPYGVPGDRLYRTGDLARWRPDGEIEYLGRLDRQVKIRGFRVELGEIEAELAAQQEIRSAAVLAVPGQDGGRRMVAYLVAETTEVPAADLADRLRHRLPDHMVPATYLWLPEFPLTHNGKLDVTALPEPADGTAGDGPPPTGPVEHAIAKVWREVLGVPNVGALDDFFALGGDSIRSLKVIARLRRLGYRVAVGELFGKPTVRALAAELDLDPAPPTEPVAAPSAPAFGLVNPRDLALLEQRFGESTS